MSESRTVRVMCPVCEIDGALSVTVTITPACKESGSRETGWSPEEPEVIEYEVLNLCEKCGTPLGQDEARSVAHAAHEAVAGK